MSAIIPLPAPNTLNTHRVCLVFGLKRTLARLRESKLGRTPWLADRKPTSWLRAARTVERQGVRFHISEGMDYATNEPGVRAIKSRLASCRAHQPTWTQEPVTVSSARSRTNALDVHQVNAVWSPV